MLPSLLELPFPPTILVAARATIQLAKYQERVNNMRSIIALVLAVCLTSSASASVVFTITQDTPGPIVLGNSAVFSIKIYSDAGTINNLAGIDFVIEANDPGFTGTATAGGQFTSGTNDFFAPNGGYALGFPSSFQVFGANAGGGLQLTSTPTTLATLTLSTTGATAGTYTMNLSSLVAVDPLFNALPIVTASPLSYSIITAVPEPSSILLLACCGLGIVPFHRRRS